jgi:hypothetical protein
MERRIFCEFSQGNSAGAALAPHRQGRHLLSLQGGVKQKSVGKGAVGSRANVVCA